MLIRKGKPYCAILLFCCLFFYFSSAVSARAETTGVSYQGTEEGSGYLCVPRFLSGEEENQPNSGTVGIFSAETRVFSEWNRTFVLPSAYDSRNQVNEAGVPYVLPVRNQGSDGTCWAFSVCSAAETSMIQQNLFQEPKVLSPLQFTWFHYNRILNPLGLSGPDRVLTTKNIFSVGGNEYLSTFALADWIGLTDETLAPYETVDAVLQSGLRGSLCYAENAACLENAFWIGSENRDAVKEQLLENGSAVLPFYMDTRYYNQETYGYYCSEERYDEAEESFHSNHMVTIVGWDDHFSRENFRTKPQGDGAWLVKNSWGQNWGQNGYFWISYYDNSIYAERNGEPIGATVTFFDMTLPDTWDNNYYYDGGGGISWYYFEDDVTQDPVPMAMVANVYTAQYEEKLSAVSFYTIQEKVAYTVYVYCNVDTSISPTGGQFYSAKVSGVLEHPGYHTITLPEEVDLSPGMKYTIAVEMDSQKETEAIKFLADGSTNWEWVNFSSQVGKGESYYREPGKNWNDVTEDGSGWYGNFRIHALTRLVHKERGDVDADGKKTTSDALKLLKLIAKINSESYWQNQIGDVNQDGRISTEDALKILKQIAKLE